MQLNHRDFSTAVLPSQEFPQCCTYVLIAKMFSETILVSKFVFLDKGIGLVD